MFSSGALPLLPRATVRVALVVPTFWLPKSSEAGLKSTVGAVPVPESDTVALVPVWSVVIVAVAPRAPIAVG